MRAGVIGLAVWLGVLWALAWRCMTAADERRDALAVLALAGFVVLLIAGIVGVYQLGEVPS